MRILRYGALVLGLVLVVTVALAYGLRTSHVESQRMSSAERLADQAAVRLQSVIDVAGVAVALADDPAVAEAALPQLAPVVWTVERIDATSIDGASGGDAVAIEVDGPIITMTVVGPTLVAEASLVAHELLVRTATQSELGPTTWLGDARLSVVHGPGEQALADAGMMTSGRTVVEAPLSDAAGPRVAISMPASGGLESGERTFLLVVLVLAALLLVLSGATVLAEARNLLRRARLDPLTGLPNRGEFERHSDELLVTARRTGSSLCLLLFDLDGFKAINDEHGHRVGDEVLQVVGSRLRRAVRESDMVARWGGDEFVVVMPGIEDVNLAQVRAATLAAQISEPDVGPGLRIGVSIGVALSPLHGDNLAALVEAADSAMYEAKRGGEVFRLAEAPAKPTGGLPTLSV